MITFDNATDKKIDFTRIERHFCKCYACKQSTTVDFEVVGWSFWWYNGDMWVEEPRVEYYRLEGENKIHVKSMYIAKCPRCSAPAERMKRSRLKTKKLSVKHVCDDRCQKATSEKCECSCNGLQHGIKNILHDVMIVS
jgi:hypothetical protein